MQKMIAVLLIASLTAMLTPALTETCTVAQIPVFRETLTGETLSLRWYDDMPSVPCLGLSTYPALFLGKPMEVQNNGDGTYVFTAEGGATAVVDVNAGTLTCADFPAFTNLMGAVLPGMDNQYLDMPGFVLPDGLAYADPDPVTLDFAKYHIPLHGEADDVCLPLATLSDVFTNLAYMYVSFNGEKVYVNFDNLLDPAWQRDPDYADPIYRRADRPADLAAFAYNELCFAVDTFYGYPGCAPINDALMQRGLDGALQTFSDTSRRCRELLMSEKLGEYAAGSVILSALLEDGGHTGMNFGALYTEKPEFADYAIDRAMADAQGGADMTAYVAYREKVALRKRLQQRRRDALGSGHYAEKGDTAVIWFDSFMYDFDGWSSWYRGEGPKPEGDQMRHVIDGLNRAAQNPAIQNVVFDLSCNTGGSADMVVAILSLIAEVPQFDAENRLIHRVVTQKYRVDRNFDGAFDEKDAEVRYDFRYGVLTSRLSFSCGNLMPSLMKDMGMAVLGETSGGGTCAVEMHATPEGLAYQFSSGLGRLVNAAGEPIEEGVPVDAALDEDAFYDLIALSDAMNRAYDGPRASPGP